jgi:hypothetical protein
MLEILKSKIALWRSGRGILIVNCGGQPHGEWLAIPAFIRRQDEGGK